MVKIDYRRQRNFAYEPINSELVRDFSEGQKTELAPDKTDFDKFTEVQNMIQNGADFDLRRGLDTLVTISEIKRIDIFRELSTNKLMGVVKTAADVSKLVSIDRDTGDQTDEITGIASELANPMISLRSFLYLANTETAIQRHGSSGNGTIVLPSDQIANLLVTDGERLWCSTTEGGLLFSELQNGAVTNFTQSGTDLDRAGVANSHITDFQALASSGRRILVVGKNRAELHQTPDPIDGFTTFPADVATMKQAWDGIGVSSSGAVKSINGDFYLKPEDDTLYIIRIGEDKPRAIRDDRGEMERLKFDDCQMEYDQDKNLLYIACKTKNSTINDRIIAYNILDETFSFFDNVFPANFAADKDNVYYRAAFGDKIEAAFGDTVLTDNGVAINWKVKTAATYANSLDNFKRSVGVFANVLIFEDTDVTVKLFDQEKTGTQVENEIFSITFPLKEASSPFDDSLQYLGLGVYGGMGFSFEENFSEYYNIDTKVFLTFFRASMSLSGANTNKLKVRGLALFSQITNRETRALTMN